MQRSNLNSFQHDITHDVDLDIVISDDHKTVTIHIVKTKKPERIDDTPTYERGGEAGETWILDARQFGPDAEFVLPIKEDRTLPRWKLFEKNWGFESKESKDYECDYYKLKIKNIRFGRNAGRSLTYIFALEKEQREQGQYFIWTVRAITDFWEDTFVFGDTSGSPVSFRKHVGGNRQPLLKVLTNQKHLLLLRKDQKKLLGKTLFSIFNGLLAQRGYQIDVNKESKAKTPDFQIELSPNIIWTVKSHNSEEPLLVGLHKLCLIRSLSFAWCTGAVENAVKKDEKEGIDSDLCAALSSTMPSVVLGKAKIEISDNALDFWEEDSDPEKRTGVSLTAEPESKDPKESLVLRLRVDDIDGSEHDRKETRAIGVIAAKWKLNLYDKGIHTGPFFPVAGKLRSESQFKGNFLNTRISFRGDILDGEIVEEKKNKCISSPIGQTVIAGLTPVDPNNLQEKDPFQQLPNAAVRVALETESKTPEPTNLEGFFKNYTLNWAEVCCLLRETSIALEGVNYSRLLFDRTVVTFLYTDANRSLPVVPTGSTVFLNAKIQNVIARLDLSGATLRVARDVDLVSLSFRFANLYLDVRKVCKKIGDKTYETYEVEIVSNNSQSNHLLEQRTHWHSSGLIQLDTEETNTELRRRSARAQDTRPMLIVEFPPQHVMEEAFFLPGPAPLPDNAGVANSDREMPYVKGTKTGSDFNFSCKYEKQGTASEFCKDKGGKFTGNFIIAPTDIDAILTALSVLESEEHRKKFREQILNIKKEGDEQDQKDFADFAKKYNKSDLHDIQRQVDSSTGRKTPSDQRIYIGPYAMDPDAYAIARKVARRIWKDTLTNILLSLFHEVQAHAQQWNRTKNNDKAPDTFELKLLREAVLESIVPSYQQFRSFYHDRKLEESIGRGNFPPKPEDLEYIIPDTRLVANDIDDPKVPEKEYYKYYKEWLTDQKDPTGLAEARLSRSSRLVFAINCRDAVALGRPAIVKDADTYETISPAEQNRMDFSFEALTNWSDMELRVVPRAQQVFLPGPDGRLEANTNRQVVDVSPGAMLDHLGFTDGPLTTANVRLAEIHGAISTRPTVYESEIVVPARLSLSTHSNAVFLAPQIISNEIFSDSSDKNIATNTDADQIHQTHALWTAKLICDGLDPGLRAVYSPDLRADFVFTGLQQRDGKHLLIKDKNGDPIKDENGNPVSLSRLPGGSMPPGSALAPWFIGPGESIADHPSILELRDSLQDRLDKVGLGEFFNEQIKNDEQFCELLFKAGNEEKRKLFPQLFSDLCRPVLDRSRSLKSRSEEESKCPINSENYDRLRQFRTSLSPRDRAELVILGSAWGLPVVGRRNQTGGLTADSSQMEPEERHRLADVMPGSALYEPKPLKVDELTLSALGASFRHNTAFQPPASARHIADRELFDALSIEQWQHWTVLGRDIFTEVVYKGFFIPCSHRVAMVRITERTFIRDSETKLIRTYLRQRIKLRCAKPKKLFPAIGQPNGGRRFPCGSIEILTTQTPDIVDPYDGGRVKDDVGPGGLIDLKGGTGLVFWPRTAKIDGAEVRFEMMVDGVKTDLPLIFVDNTAANDPETMSALTAYYNKLDTPDQKEELISVVPKKHKRTLALNGEKLRYAPEIRSGSTSIETDYWTLAIEGREENQPTRATSKDDGITNFILDNSKFIFDPVLQGADQPPVYPLIASCRVRLRQSERLTGKVHSAVRARINGDFVVNGLPSSERISQTSDDNPWDYNPQQIFLDLFGYKHDQPELDMGSRGDQSGGIYRPAGYYISFSRTKGLLTYEKRVESENTTRIDSVSSHGSLFYGSSTPRVANIQAETSDEQKKLKELKETLKKFFSDESMLFGLITIRKLIDYLGTELEDPETGAPELIEQVRYGAQQAGGKAQESIETVRQTVVKPLSAAIKGVRRQWDALGAELQRRQNALPLDKTKGIIQAITLAEVFPELDQGLRELDKAIDEALSETNPILSGLILSEVYESGRRFLDAIIATSANPAERISDAVEQRFNGLQKFVGDLLNEFNTLALDYIKYFPTGDNLIPFLVNIALPASSEEDGNKPWPYLPWPYPGFESLGKDAAKEVRLLLAPRVSKMREVAERIFKILIEEPRPADPVDFKKKLEEVFKEEVNTLKEDAKTCVSKAENKILEICNPDDSESCKSVLLELKVYESLLKSDSEFIKDILYESIKDELAFVEKLWSHFDEIRRYLKDGKIAEAGNAAVRLIEIFVGEIDLDVNKIRGENSLSMVLKKTGEKISLGELELCLYVPDSNNELSRCPEKFPFREKFNPSNPEEPPVDSFCTHLYETQVKISILLEKIHPNKINEIKAALKSNETVDELIAKLTEGLLGTESALKTTGQTTAATFAAIYNDTIDVAALQTALKAAIKKFEGDYCTPGSFDNDIRQLAELPKLLGQFARGRSEMLMRLTKNLETLVKTFVDLFKDRTFQEFLAAGGLGAELAAHWKECNSDDQNCNGVVMTGKKVVEHIEDAATQYAKELALMLALAANKLSELAKKLKESIEEPTVGLLNYINEFNKNGLITVEVKGLEESLKTVDSVLKTAECLTKKLTEAAGDNNFTLQKLRDLKLNEGDQFYAIDFFMPNPEISIKTTDVLQKFEAEVSEFVIGISKLGRQYIRNMQSEVLNKLDGVVINMLKDTTNSIGIIYSSLSVKRHDLIKAFPDGFEDTILGKELVRNLFVEQRKDKFGYGSKETVPPNPDRLDRDVQFLYKVKEKDKDEYVDKDGWLMTNPVSNRDHRRFLKTFISEWMKVKGYDLPTPLKLGQQVANFTIELARGRLLQMIPLDEIRNAIEEELLNLVPIKTDLSYGFGLKLGPEVAAATMGIFKPVPNCPLRIDFRAELDLLAGSQKLNLLSTGSLGAFDIVLVGDAFKAVTLKFSSASFVSRNGQKPKTDLVYSDVEIGPELAFLQNLQSFLSPKDGSGFYLKPSRGFPGIEAGYTLSIGDIIIGNISIFNISLNAAVIIPFDGGRTRFKCSLSSRDRPFTIAYMPYGGSGFFALYADCQGIIGFEASFEFGGAGIFSVGPLQGQGRIMAGVYIRHLVLDSGTIAEILGTSYMGGSACIWIFSLSAALSVRMGQVKVNGKSNMVGNATFTFTFSLGLKDFDYSISVRREEEQGFGGASPAAFAGMEDAARVGMVATETSDGRKATIKADVKSQRTEWKDYKKYFDESIAVHDYFA